MRFPTLFRANDTAATNTSKIGLGVLSETISCSVTEELNGAFECELTYPTSGALFSEILLHRIIAVSPAYDESPQPFRIYKITAPMNGSITIYAEHISYDLNKYAIAPFTAASLAEAFVKMGSADFNVNVASGSPAFTFATDKSSTTAFSSATPCPARALLGGNEGSILDVYGGEYRYRGYEVYLMSRRGKDLDFTITYGKNLIDITKETSSAAAYTHVYPFWYKTNDETSQLVTLDDKIIPYGDGVAEFTNDIRVYSLDLSDFWEEDEIPTGAPSKTQLNDAAKVWMGRNSSYFSSSISLSIDWIQFKNYSNYQSFVVPDVALGDSVRVLYPKFNLDIRLRATKIVYDPLLKRYENITLGTVKATAADTIAANKKDISDAAAKEKKQIVSVAKGGTGVTSLNALKNALNLYVQSGRTDAVSAEASAVTTFEVTFEKPYKTRPIINHSIYRASMTNAAFGRIFSYMNPVQTQGQYTGVKFYVANNYTSPLNIRVYWDAIGEAVL